MIPKIQMYEIFTLQFDSVSSPFSKNGKRFLTAYALIFKMRVCTTLLAIVLISSIPSAMYTMTIYTILLA